MLLFTMTISLFLIMDSVGNITDFLNLIRDLPAERQKRIILREMVIALAIMVIFKYFGAVLLSYLEVGPATVQIAETPHARDASRHLHAVSIGV